MKPMEYTMKSIVLVYGLVAGVVVIASTVAGFYLTGDAHGGNFSHWLGYLIMLVALSVIFVGIKQHRDQNQGGVITFGKAFLLGLGISVAAGIGYVASWEIHLALTDYAFIDEYTRSVVEDARAGGMSGSELAEMESSMEHVREQYGKVFYRLPLTFLEIFPVGLLVSLIAAAVLRNPKRGS